MVYVLSNPASRVTPSTCERVGCTNDIFVKETSAPNLAWDEAASKDTHEKAECNEPSGVGDEPDESGRNCAAKKTSRENIPGAELVTERAGDKAD